ncbi:MAG: PAS domain S-box protein, partial [Candidatus Thermoplasmatota archaeon]|nr:PAS domain S-box protein [Candidatus Thermoplasmatota archaeon]
MNKHNEKSQSDLILTHTKNVYLIIDKNGIILYVSPSFSHLYKSKKNLLNTSFYDLATELDQDIIKKSISSIVTNPKLSTTFIFHQKSTKEERIFQADAKNLLKDEKINGILISVHDITDNKHIQTFIKTHQNYFEQIKHLNEQKYREKTKKLKEQNKKLQEELLKQKQKESKFQEHSQQYKLLFAHANEAICVAQDGLLKLVNPKLCEMTQLHKNELVNKPFINFIHPDDKELILQRYSDRIKGKKVPDEYTFRTIDNSGKVHWVQIHAARFIWQGKPATVNFLSEITEKVYTRQKFDKIFSLAPFMFAELDIETFKIVDANIAFSKSIGISLDQLIGKRTEDFFSKKIFKERLKYAKKAIKENQVMTSTDQRAGRYFYTIYFPIDTIDGKRHLCFIAQDISDSTLAENKYKLLVDSTPDSIAEVDGETEKILLVNPSMAKNFNMSKEAMIGKDWKSFLPPELYEKRYKQGLKAITGGKIQIFEDRRKNRYYQNIFIPFKSTKGSINLQVISRDITQLKNTEKQLMESEKKYRLLVEQSADVIYTLNINDEKYTFISPAVEKLLGYSIEEAYLLKPTDILTTESYAYQKNELTKILNSGKTTSGSLELDLIHKNGSIIQAEVHSSLLFNERKQPVEILGIVRDITERKQAEKKLMEYKTALDQSAEGIALANMEGHIKFVNEAWAEMHGFSVDELIDQHLSVFHTMEQMEKEVTPFNQRLITTGSNEGEIGHVRKDGTTFPTYMTTTIIRGEEGKPLGLLGIARDITMEYHQREKERFN